MCLSSLRRHKQQGELFGLVVVIIGTYMVGYLWWSVVAAVVHGPVWRPVSQMVGPMCRPSWCLCVPGI